MYKTSSYIFGFLIVSFTSLNVFNKATITKPILNKEINFDSFKEKELSTYKIEKNCDSIKSQVKFEISLLNKELNIK